MSRFLLPTLLCGRQRKVGAAPHRGNANKPPRKQGKANTIGTQSKQTTTKAKKDQKTIQRKDQKTQTKAKPTAEQAKPQPPSIMSPIPTRGAS
ncbi:hypothetical protein PQR67_11985 [Paraburkholderia fungorum]|uniref:hypothetical protein n=1 Tax=Paraburkholderia fungorum TaxID=134537 RepID=UPI0038B7B236